MTIHKIFAYKTTTKQFQPKSKYLSVLEYAQRYAIKMLRESKKEFDDSFNKHYKCMNRNSFVPESHYPIFIYIIDMRTDEFYIFNMGKCTFTQYTPIKQKKLLSEITNYSSINKITEELFGFKSMEAYESNDIDVIDRNVYLFDDINTEIYVEYDTKKYLDKINCSKENMDRVVPVVITQLKTYGHLRSNPNEYPRYMYVCDDIELPCCTIM